MQNSIKKIFSLTAAFALILTLLLPLSGCSNKDEMRGEFTPISVESGPWHDGLAYYTDTKVVYHYVRHGSYFGLAPYISENGLFCRYIDNSIVEISPTLIIEP